jgi:hypothetical protein
MSGALFAVLLLLAIISVPVAIACAIFFYRGETAHVGCLAYALILIVCAPIAYVFALSFGIELACVWYPSGNLCGLVGFFITGPLAASVTIILVAKLLGGSRKR